MAKPTANAKITHKDGHSAESTSLKSAVHEVAKDAEHDARTGDLATVKETSNQPAEDLPTGARSHPNP